MCDGFSETAAVVTMVAAAGAAAANAYATKQNDKAEGAATQAELLRQKKLKEQGDAVVAQNIKNQGANGTDQAMQQSQQTRNSAYDQAAADATRYAPSGSNLDGTIAGPRVVSDTYRGELGKASNFLQQQAQAKAAMQSFGDAQLGNALQNAQTGYKLQNLTNDINGSQNAYGYELNAAGHAGDGSKTLGTALNAVAGVSGSAAGRGSAGSAAGSGSSYGKASGGGGGY